MSLGARAEGSEWEPTPLDTEPVSTEADGAQAARPPDEEEAGPSTGRARARPVAASERLFAVDALRGFALLGILAMNIVDFAWPDVAYGNPMRGGGFEGTDRVVWYVNHLIFEGKMMTIFSMLFGAGLVLMDQRAAARGASVRGVYYRRVLWLLAIGMVHAYLIWGGDILVLYAECGLFLYLFRNRSPRALIVLGVAALLLFVPLLLGFAAGLDSMKATAARVEARQKAGEPSTPFDKRIHEVWTEHLRKHFEPTSEERVTEWDKELSVHRGSYVGIVKERALPMLIGQIIQLIFGVPLFAGGRMLIGMGLMKMGVFSASRSWRFYANMAALGYGIGLPLMAFDAARLIEHQFEMMDQLHGGILYNAFGSVVVALGHVGTIMLIVKSGAIAWLTRRLAAVGRMALTNYLAHSIICTTLFYGYGFGLYGTINRTGLAAIVLAIWTFQLIVSPIWLRYFRFGPAEWLWRSLTYWRLQPIRVSSA